MRIYVRVKDEDVLVECGTGRNTVGWACNSAIHRYDPNYCINTGMWSEVEDEYGNKISPESAIADKVQEGTRIFLKFEEIKIEDEKPVKPAATSGKKKK